MKYSLQHFALFNMTEHTYSKYPEKKTEYTVNPSAL